MENNNNDVLVGTAAKLIVYGVMAPVAIYSAKLVSIGVIKAVNTIKHKRKIKNGLKDGSIVEIDGQYYECAISDSDK